MYRTLPTSFELELTTRCNAACVQCPRNDHGGRDWPTLPLVDFDFELLKEKFPRDFWQNISLVRLVGTYGEPIMHPDVLEIVRWLQSQTDGGIVISTNGSLRTKAWWKKLGQCFRPQDRMIWGIDGLEDTNHIYRKNTVWSKIIENLTAFNQAGGNSVWMFIPFEHNEHQVEQADQLSQQLGCMSFAVKPTHRFVDRRHQHVESFPSKDKNGNTVYHLRPPVDAKYRNSSLEKFGEVVKTHGSYENYLKQTQITCDAQTKNYFHVSAQGYVLPCGWLVDRLYGYEAENHPDQKKMFAMIQESGGFDAIDLHHRNLVEILQGPFFKRVETSWNTQDRLDRCAHICGGNSGLADAYKNLNKFRTT